MYVHVQYVYMKKASYTKSLHILITPEQLKALKNLSKAIKQSIGAIIRSYADEIIESEKKSHE